MIIGAVSSHWSGVGGPPTRPGQTHCRTLHRAIEKHPSSSTKRMGIIMSSQATPPIPPACFRAVARPDQPLHRLALLDLRDPQIRTRRTRVPFCYSPAHRCRSAAHPIVDRLPREAIPLTRAAVGQPAVHTPDQRNPGAGKTTRCPQLCSTNPGDDRAEAHHAGAAQGCSRSHACRRL